jgi:hypothetical protein
MRWLIALFWVVVVLALMWYFGILQAVGNTFDVWLRWIGARG